MTDKSYVTLEAAVCPVCTEKHQTGALLLDKRLKDRFERETVTHWEPCEKCRKMHEDGHVALVGIDAGKSADTTTPGGVWRTGEIAHVKRDTWGDIFDIPTPDGPLAFIDQEGLDKLKGIHGGEESADE